MKFKEKFPSLKGKVDSGLLILDDKTGELQAEFILKHLVERNCIDKQRLREAIKKVKDSIVVSAVNHNYPLELLEKELNL